LANPKRIYEFNKQSVLVEKKCMFFNISSRKKGRKEKAISLTQGT
jgi:hypothetical protein